MDFNIILHGIPIGPSINKVYLPIRGRFVKGNEGKIYDQQINAYKLRNFRKLQEANRIFEGHVLCVDRFFVFHKKRLFCKDGSIKKMDVENYLKTTSDGLSTLLDIDDRFFRAGITEAVSCDNEADQQLIVRISVHQPRTFEQLLGSLRPTTA